MLFQSDKIAWSLHRVFSIKLALGDCRKKESLDEKGVVLHRTGYPLENRCIVPLAVPTLPPSHPLNIDPDLLLLEQQQTVQDIQPLDDPTDISAPTTTFKAPILLPMTIQSNKKDRVRNVKQVKTSNDVEAKAFLLASLKVKCTSNELFRIRPAVGILEPQRNEDVKVIFNACKILPEDRKHCSVVYHISAKNDVSAKKRRMYGEPRGTMGICYSCGAYKGTPTAALIPSPVASTPDESNFVVGSIRVSIDHDPVMYCCSG
uniref:Major sperm protein n=1 Tax=Ditylenchus dipsaci TaxID=166011 RepID=A0A915DI51_9BILA